MTTDYSTILLTQEAREKLTQIALIHETPLPKDSEPRSTGLRDFLQILPILERARNMQELAEGADSLTPPNDLNKKTHLAWKYVADMANELGCEEPPSRQDLDPEKSIATTNKLMLRHEYRDPKKWENAPLLILPQIERDLPQAIALGETEAVGIMQNWLQKQSAELRSTLTKVDSLIAATNPKTAVDAASVTEKSSVGFARGRGNNEADDDEA